MITLTRILAGIILLFTTAHGQSVVFGGDAGLFLDAVAPDFNGCAFAGLRLGYEIDPAYMIYGYHQWGWCRFSPEAFIKQKNLRGISAETVTSQVRNWNFNTFFIAGRYTLPHDTGSVSVYGELALGMFVSQTEDVTVHFFTEDYYYRGRSETLLGGFAAVGIQVPLFRTPVSAFYEARYGRSFVSSVIADRPQQVFYSTVGFTVTVPAIR